MIDVSIPSTSGLYVDKSWIMLLCLPKTNGIHVLHLVWVWNGNTTLTWVYVILFPVRVINSIVTMEPITTISW